MSNTASDHGLAPFIVIYRGLPTEDVLAATEVLLKVGFDCFEVSLTTEDALVSIEALHREFSEAALIGAGTVRTEADVDAVRDAGAGLILSPETYQPVIARAKGYGLHTIPGAYTPTEVGDACRFGADTVKIFPAGRDGVEYFRLLRDPMPDVPLLVTGGVVAESARAYFEAGAMSIGVGAQLLGGDALVARDWPLLAQQAAGYRAAALGQ